MEHIKKTLPQKVKKSHSNVKQVSRGRGLWRERCGSPEEEDEDLATQSEGNGRGEVNYKATGNDEEKLGQCYQSLSEGPGYG